MYVVQKDQFGEGYVVVATERPLMARGLKYDEACALAQALNDEAEKRRQK